ncbi:MAG: menaquinone biosynthesis decarboxylase [Lacrimispora sp.]|uniref:menaquinone biosynthesis decarboxylase n=1 Tax=Lacrimispora sp. TaxID=2719234 RepID=UPI0039E64587
MSYRGLAGFIHLLEERGELIRIKTKVSPLLEITEITDKVCKRKDSGNKALLFEQVEGSPYPVLMNAFGTDKRMALSLGADNLDDIAADIGAYLDFGNYSSFSRLISFGPKLLRLLCCFPLRSRFHLKRPSCQQVIEREPDLGQLPVLQCWPLDGGRFFTLPLVFTKYPDTKLQNIGMYRMQVLDSKTTAMHWQKHKDGAGIYEAYRKKGGLMPVSVALGCDPAVTYASTAPLPPKLDEMMLAGFLRKWPVKMVKCVTNDLYVPADAEFVLEGYVDPDEELVWEGPFGDHTGYYSLADWYPKFHITAITHKKNPVYPATVVGKPPMEDCYMAKATERIFLPLLKMMMPELREIHLPFEGVFHNCAVVSVKQSYPGAARTVMNAIWGMGQMRTAKLIVAVDETVDPSDAAAVWREVLSYGDPQKDFVVSEGPLDSLDHSSDLPLYGGRLGIDATRRGKEPFEGGALEIVPISKEQPWDGRRKALAMLEEKRSSFILVVDEDVDPSDHSTVMWRVFNNIDVTRDLFTDGRRAAFDATRKRTEEGLSRPWPEDIVMTEEIRKRVSEKWSAYGIDNPKDSK